MFCARILHLHGNLPFQHSVKQVPYQVLAPSLGKLWGFPVLQREIIKSQGDQFTNVLHAGNQVGSDSGLPAVGVKGRGKKLAER